MVLYEVVGAIIPVVTADHPTAESALPISGQLVIFLDYPGGCGKTFVRRNIQLFLLMRRNNVITVATSAVAAKIIYKVVTDH